ncbi:MAG: biotin--[acetyl-CoA-carboxylase] ligase [Verrucomicrobiota bacterium]
MKPGPTLQPFFIYRFLEKNGSHLGWEIEVRDETDSTNRQLKDEILRGEARSGRVLFAEWQSAGQGRRGNPWVGDPGRHLLFSFCLQPKLEPTRISCLTHLTALALCRTLEDHHLQPEIKWPNDIYLNGRKVAGILVECLSGNNGLWVVVGIGLNVNGRDDEFPPELRPIATNLRAHLGGEQEREPLAASILAHFENLLEMARDSFTSLLPDLEKRSFLSGHWIQATHNDEKHTGRVTGLGPEGELMLEQPDGRTFPLINATEVRIVNP